MTVHAPTDVRSITIPAERGGCGQPHDAGELVDGDRFCVTCAACEPHIIAARIGWAHDPMGVALTPDEVGEVEAHEASAKRAHNRTWGDPQVLGDVIASALRSSAGEPASAPSLLVQIAALSQEERAALAAMLNATPPPLATPTSSGWGVAEVGGTWTALGGSANNYSTPHSTPLTVAEDPVAATLVVGEPVGADVDNDDWADDGTSPIASNPLDAAVPVKRGPGRPRKNF